MVRKRYFPGSQQYSGVRVAKDVPAYRSMGLHQLELFGRVRALLEENGVRYAYFTDIVHGAAEEYRLDRLLGKPQVRGEEPGVQAYPLYVAPCLPVPVLGGQSQPVDGLDIAVPYLLEGALELHGLVDDLAFKLFSVLQQIVFVPLYLQKVPDARPEFGLVHGLAQKLVRA